jgi:hypothetical protein
LKDFLIVCLILENQWLIFLCAFVFFVVKYEFMRFVSVQNLPWAHSAALRVNPAEGAKGRVSVALWFPFSEKLNDGKTAAQFY